MKMYSTVLNAKFLNNESIQIDFFYLAAGHVEVKVEPSTILLDLWQFKY